MKDDPTIPKPPTAEEIESIGDLGSARLLLRQVIAMIATLTALIEGLRETIVELKETNELQRHEMEQLKRALFGQKSERMLPAEREIKRQRKKGRDRAGEGRAPCPHPRDTTQECRSSTRRYPGGDRRA